MTIKIKPVSQKDLGILNKKLGAWNLPSLHEEKFKEQKRGDSLWIIAWKGKEPIAHAQVRFKGSKIKKVRDNLKNSAHFESLYVKDAFRKKGVSTKIMDFSENLVRKKGINKIGLSVEEGNSFLLNLYKKRGYKDWGHGTVKETWNELESPRGKITKIIQKSNYLIKELK